MKLLVLRHTAAILLLSASVSAHPGHGEVKVLSGAVIVIETERIQISVFDRDSFSHKRVFVIVDSHTRIESGKTRLQLSDLRPSQEIDCMAETEEGKDGATALRALRIRLKKAK